MEKQSKPKDLGFWYDRPISELTREELLEVIDYMSEEIKRYRQVMPYVDYKKMIIDNVTIL